MLLKNKWAKIFIIGVIFLAFSVGGCTENPGQFRGKNSSKAKNNKPSGRAVSLKALERKFKSGATNKDLAKARRLYGLKKINGFVIDKNKQTGKIKDIIIIGETGRGLPPLYLDDFVIALRNAWMVYAEKQGNTYYYANPGCSIDPRPENLQNMRQILSEINPDNSQELLGSQRWLAVSKAPQDVKVLGIPRNSHFAKVMIDADYYLKKISDGSVSLAVKGLGNLHDSFLREAKAQLSSGSEEPASLSRFNRFWFSPGKNSIYDEKDVSYIKKSPVKLLTEAEHLGNTGQLVGQGREDPAAKKFVEDFTSKYSQVAKEDSRYAELSALYRFVAIAKLLKYKHADATDILNYWLNQYQVDEVNTPDTLPTVTRVSPFSSKTVSGNKITTLYLWVVSYGGVDIGIDIGDDTILPSSSIIKMKTKVIETRPSLNTVYWDFPFKRIVQLAPKNNFAFS